MSYEPSRKESVRNFDAKMNSDAQFRLAKETRRLKFQAGYGYNRNADERKLFCD
jgi:hypothetical protein